jgi:hypothetical protein
MEQQKTYITNGNVAGVYAQLCTALSTALVIHAQRVPGDVNWQTNYPSVFTALAANGLSQLVLGEPPRSVEDSPTVPVINAFLRNQALARGLAFIDQNKLLGSSNTALAAPLGWGVGDGVHLDAPAHRYLAGKILSALDWFRLGGNKLDADPLTMGQYLKRRLKIMALQSLTSYTISGRGGSTVDGAVVSGGFTNSVANDKGFIFTGAAALGAAACRPGLVPMSVNVKTNVASFCVAFVGYRNLALTTGTRGFVLVGVTSTFSSLAALNQRCFGFEVALGSDVGSPEGVTTEVVRLLSSTGAATTYGPWVRANSAGELATSQSGLKLAIVWNRTKSRLELYRASAQNFTLAAILNNADLLANGCAGAYVNLALVAEDAGNVPVAAGAMSFLEIKSSWGNAATEHGISNNDLVAL